MIAVGKVDIGLKRRNNQDNIFLQDTKIGKLPNLYIVADGMGGYNSGDIASTCAIKTFCEYIKEHDEVVLDTPELITNLLTRAISHANFVVNQMAMREEKLQGMGTTLTVATIIDGSIYISHVGDTRVYAMNKNQIIQLTTDHSLVREMYDNGVITYDEMNFHPMSHMITRAVGSFDKVKVDNFMCEMTHVEYILMCSDGLTTTVQDEEILEIVYREERDLHVIVDELIETTNTRGGNDNIAIILGKEV
ncbi:MAG: hypothetical protein BEN19_00185 [Epulopiscium sp. Nuni2H_MBin003]|nr:MAG: hypothetical protein BEN19_00185 [Epulopiscium sp. Nuni2H_MBin003]